MAELFQPLDAFPGFGVLYDPLKNPYFRLIMVENLKRLQSVAVGKSLLSAIQNAKPASRKDFPLGINVICKPTAMMAGWAIRTLAKARRASGKSQSLHDLEHTAALVGGEVGTECCRDRNNRRDDCSAFANLG